MIQIFRSAIGFLYLIMEKQGQTYVDAHVLSVIS